MEVHSYYRRQVEIAERVDLVYDFALPPLVLHALYTGDGAALTRWLRERPAATRSPCSTPMTASASSTSGPIRPSNREEPRLVS